MTGGGTEAEVASCYPACGILVAARPAGVQRYPMGMSRICSHFTSSRLSPPLRLLLGYADPLIYNARFVGAVLKQVYIAESLAPPKSLNALTSSYKTLYSRVIDANYFPSLIKSGEWKKVGVYAVEAYGIFTIGEMVSRNGSAEEQVNTP